MKQLDQKAVWMFFLSYAMPWFSFLFIFSIPFMGIILSESRSVLLGLLLALSVFSILSSVILWVIAKFSYRFYKYELREDGFRKELGIIHKKYVTIPYDRIQNVDIHRGIVTRILGLSNLNIQTAGATSLGAEGRLPGLSREVAEELRDELIKRARQSTARNQGL